MLELAQETTEIRLTSDDVRLTFWLDGDRWRHAGSRRDGAGAWRRVWESVDAPEPARPTSPVYQAVHLDPPEHDRAVVHLMGQHLRDVYSASIVWDAAAGRIDFDVAARVRDPSRAAPGSRYHGELWHALQPTAETARMDLASAACEFRPAGPEQPRTAALRWRYAWILLQ